MQALFIAACLAFIALMLWLQHAVTRAASARTLLPPVLVIGALILVWDWTADRDAAARLAMERLERETVRLDDCPAPARGLSDTVALIVNAPAGEQPRLAECYRIQERARAIRERIDRRKNKLAEAK